MPRSRETESKCAIAPRPAVCLFLQSYGTWLVRVSTAHWSSFLLGRLAGKESAHQPYLYCWCDRPFTCYLPSTYHSANAAQHPKHPKNKVFHLPAVLTCCNYCTAPNIICLGYIYSPKALLLLKQQADSAARRIAPVTKASPTSLPAAAEHCPSHYSPATPTEPAAIFSNDCSSPNTERSEDRPPRWRSSFVPRFLARPSRSRAGIELLGQTAACASSLTRISRYTDLQPVGMGAFGLVW